MKKTMTSKLLTLVLFAGLITIFLLYRNGNLNSFMQSNNVTLQTSPNGGALNPASTKVAKTDSVKRPMLFFKINSYYTTNSVSKTLH